MIIKIYLIGCIVAFIIGWIQAEKDHNAGHDISQFGAAIVVIVMLSWIYVAWYWYNSDRGGPKIR